ncbi:MAG: T9SS type A sorting domain-containing protein [Bacteroidetes bacterium]|nr:T9SS type A sorting domain-containing protein [Bacteroidota bacterium]
MKKYLVLFILAIGISILGFGQVTLPHYDALNYTPGLSLSSQANWTKLNSGDSLLIASGNLTYPNLAASSGNKLTFDAAGVDAAKLFTQQTAGTVYFSFIMKITALGSLNTTGGYFGGFTEGTTTTFGATIWSRSDGAGFDLGINPRTTAANTVWSAGTTALNSTMLVVIAYKIETGASNDSVKMWINPDAATFGGTAPAPTVVAKNATLADLANVNRILIRQDGTSATPFIEMDEFRIGTAWADVTPTGTITAPTTQTRDFTFANILQNQMDVAWTNGNGTNRVVKINTSNSFTTPGDGTSPSASAAYTGPGEQVIYNGAGSSVTVTGLSTATTYWFKAWEYNGAGAGTVYCGLVGANNPLSQATAATATPPIVTTPTATAITATSALLGGTITADGGSPITERGTVWSLTTPVTISDNKLAEGGTAISVFTHTRTGLPFNTLIHYAAYAINNAGPSLSAESSFTTLFGEPTNQASAFAATSPSYSSVTNTWADNDGTQAATGFLIMANLTGTFTNPVDGSQPTSDPNLTDGSGFVYVNHGAQTYTWTGLTSSTHYYFAIYAYTNTGTSIDYKLIPAAPLADVFTSAFIQPLAAWTFDDTPAKPNTPLFVPANFGTQMNSATLYADGSNGSSAFICSLVDTELDAFSGTTLNDPREGAAIVSGVSYCPAGGVSPYANGKAMVIKFSMSALQDPILTFVTRGTATGFNTHQWAWSINGSTFTDFGTNTANTGSSFVTKTLDLSSINAVDGAPEVYLRIIYNGASSPTGNNRLDNIVIRASAATTLAPTVITNLATSVGSTTAILNGTVNANNQTTSVNFEYGLSETYGTTVAGVPASVTGNLTTPVTANLTGLAFNKTYHFRITASNTNGTSNGADQVFSTTCPTPDDAGVISGPTTVCANGTTQYIYTVPAIANATEYVWSFPLGTTFVSGETTNTVTVTFNAGTSSGDVSVFGFNECGDGNGSELYPIVTNQPVAVSVSIVASANPVNSGTSVTFTATPLNGGITPVFVWKVNGITVGTNSSTYTYVPLNNDVVVCTVTSSISCTTGSPANSNQIMMAVTGIPSTLAVTGTVAAGEAICYNATQTITVAGNGTTFEVLLNGGATMIAGQNIIYLPGTKVNAGGYMWGHIAPAGPYCSGKAPEKLVPVEESGLSLMDNSFKIYPNPTSGVFTIEQRGDLTSGQVKVEVLGTLGGRILTTEFQGLRKQELSIKGNPPGIYFVKVSAGEKVQTVKIILTN